MSDTFEVSYIFNFLYRGALLRDFYFISNNFFVAVKSPARSE
jgi:hypothetical protein